MPRVKKTNPKVSLRMSKRGRKKVKATPDSTLQQALISNVVQLEKYWKKQITGLRKQLQAAIAAHKKMAAKQKAAKKARALAKASKSRTKLTKTTKVFQDILKKVDILKEAVNQARTQLTQATLASEKYVTLSKMITQFERDWLKKMAERTSAATEKKAKVGRPKKTAAKKEKAPTHQKRAYKRRKKEEITPEETPMFTDGSSLSFLEEDLKNFDENQSNVKSYEGSEPFAEEEDYPS